MWSVCRERAQRSRTQQLQCATVSQHSLYSYGIGMLWNRDVNAAINILRLFLDWVEGRTKPIEFRRAAL